MDYTDLFGPISDDCCGVTSTELQDLISDYYNTIAGTIFGMIDSAYALEIFGKETEQQYNAINDLHYLLTLLIIIYYEKQDDALWSDDGLPEDADYYYENHNLECIQNAFVCKGVDITPLLSIFGVNPNNPSGGIGSRYIEVAPPEGVIFKVN